MGGNYEIEAPFDRGQTYFGQTTGDSSDAQNYEGHEYTFQDLDFGAGIETRVRVVRNIAAVSLLPKRLANLATSGFTNGMYGTRIDGYTTTQGAKGYPIDNKLAVGVQPNDLCYIVVRGLAVVTVALAAGAGNVIVAGASLAAVTAATSQATTAGRLALADYTGATLLLANNIMNSFVAISAATTANTGADLLIYVGSW